MLDYYGYLQLSISDLFFGSVFILVAGWFFGWFANILTGKKLGCLPLFGLGLLGSFLGLLIAYISWWLLNDYSGWFITVPGWWVVGNLALISFVGCAIVIKIRSLILKKMKH